MTRMGLSAGEVVERGGLILSGRSTKAAVVIVCWLVYNKPTLTMWSVGCASTRVIRRVDVAQQERPLLWVFPLVSKGYE